MNYKGDGDQTTETTAAVTAAMEGDDWAIFCRSAAATHDDFDDVDD